MGNLQFGGSVAEPYRTALLSIDEDGQALAGLLRADRVSEAQFRTLEQVASRHGVLPLLASHSDGERARAILRQAAVIDAAATTALAEALDLLQAAGIRVLVLKGAQLAFTHYAAPHLRPRLDNDLLISEPSRNAARRALECAGFSLVPQVRGDLILTQMLLVRARASFAHPLDVHWQVLNPYAFRHLLRFEDAWSRNRPIPALGLSARGLSVADAMLVASTHPSAHHSGDVALIWIVDIDRLAASMSAEEWAEFADRACAARVARVALASLMTASRLLGTEVPDGVLSTLANHEADQRATLAYLESATRAERLWSELSLVHGWTRRARYLGQHLFPDRAYMRNVYGGGPLTLPWHYFRRVAFGAARWLRRTDAG